MRRRGALVAALLAAFAVLAVWRFLPAAAPPLYEGVCQADPYVSLASGGRPAPASKQYPAEPDGNFPTSEVITTENPSQAQVLMTDGTFQSDEPFTVSITPLRPSGPEPGNGHIDGNVYRIVAVTASGSQLQPVDAQHPLTILLRATHMNPPRVLERLDGSTWTPLKTYLAGCGDTFEGVSTRTGDFAMVLPGGGASSGGGGGGFPIVPVVAVLTAIVVISLLALVRLARPAAP